MTERNGADVVREYMASPNNPMRALAATLRCEAAEDHRNAFFDIADQKRSIAKRIEAALADTGELVSRIDYLWMTQRPEREALRALLDKLDIVNEASQGVFELAVSHGMPYMGPNWSEEYKAGRAVLGKP